MTPEQIHQRVKDLGSWYHSIDYGNGVIAPDHGVHEHHMTVANILFRMGIEGRSILDVGAWNGFYSFEAEKRGASRVLAVDKFCWVNGNGRAQFEFAKGALGSKIEDKLIDIPEMSPETVGTFDIVLFNGIVYHIVDPINAIERMSKIAKHVLTVETVIDNQDNPRPVMVFYRGENNPPTRPQHGWGPNSLLMHALLKHYGFETVLEYETPSAGRDRSIFMAFKPGHPFQDFVEANQEYARPRIVAA
jgi:tRNA (mo5U34)-methyltransferase